MIVNCPDCDHRIQFEQPYAYHAGFANQGFLYSDAGTSTLIWSSLDPAYEAVVGAHHPWALDVEQQSLLEAQLKPAPDGGAWRFSNPPRCPACAAPIGEPIGGSIYYFRYPESVVLDQGPAERSFHEVLEPAA